MYTPNTRSHERALSMRCVIRMCSRSFKEAVTCKVRRFEARKTGEEAATGMIGMVRLRNGQNGLVILVPRGKVNMGSAVQRERKTGKKKGSGPGKGNGQRVKKIESRTKGHSKLQPWASLHFPESRSGRVDVHQGIPRWIEFDPREGEWSVHFVSLFSPL